MSSPLYPDLVRFFFMQSHVGWIVVGGTEVLVWFLFVVTPLQPTPVTFAPFLYFMMLKVVRSVCQKRQRYKLLS